MHMAMTGTLVEGSFPHMLLQEALKNLKVVVILSVTVRIRHILWWTWLSITWLLIFWLYSASLLAYSICNY